MPRPRKRTLRMVLLLLTFSGGGAIINIAVGIMMNMLARGADYVRRDSHKVSYVTLDDGRIIMWTTEVLYRWNSAFISSRREWEAEGSKTKLPKEHATLPFWGHSLVTPHPSFLSGEVGIEYRVVVADGWPCVALTHELIDKGVRFRLTVEDAFVIGEWKPNESYPVVVPYHLTWPGFAINTIFYAAILWVLWIAPGKIRRFIRVRRGRCPACAYPVGTSPVCTECGTALPRQAFG